MGNLDDSVSRVRALSQRQFSTAFPGLRWIIPGLCLQNRNPKIILQLFLKKTLLQELGPVYKEGGLP